MASRRVILTRTQTGAEIGHAGTLGALFVEDQHGARLFECMTLEDDWLDNRPNQSCIPAGTYRLKRRLYYKYHDAGKVLSSHGAWTYEVAAVPGRTAILVHPGVTEEHTEGCILVGRAIKWVTVKRDEDTGEAQARKLGLDESAATFQRWMDVMEGVEECDIDVKWIAGLP